MKLSHSNKFEANKWLVSVRWFYAPAIFVMGLVSRLDPYGDSVFPLPIMIFLFSVFILTNVLFYRLIKKLELENNLFKINIVGISQILTELGFFFIILHLSGGIDGVSSIFFFIPIVSSIVLFSPIASLFIAFISVILVNGYALLEFYGVAQNIIGYSGPSVLTYPELLSKLPRIVITSAVYFIVGSLAGYISSAIKSKEFELAENKRQADLQSEKLRLLNEEYNAYARKLVKKDLELTKENEEITKLDRDRSDFLSTIAHQLRTPLSAVKWTLNILLEGSSGELNNDQRTLMLKAYESNERIIGLIQDMLGADRVRYKTADFSPVEISLQDLVKNVMSDFKLLVEHKGLRFEMESDKDLPKAIVDPQKIRAVFQNLIENAVKYSKKGGFIKITMHKDGDKVQVVIEDNGIGIPKSDQQNIFQRFFRANNAVKFESNGTGLGLFIIRSIIERHGGEINFESEENKGTKFILHLPIAQG